MIVIAPSKKKESIAGCCQVEAGLKEIFFTPETVNSTCVLLC